MSPHTIEEIERAIETLNPEEIEELYDWLDHRRRHPVDVRAQSDLEAGCLDEPIGRALADEKNGRIRPL